MRDRLSDEKRKLDEEQLKSADLENQLARMEEDLNFKMQLLEKELTEVNTLPSCYFSVNDDGVVNVVGSKQTEASTIK